jgi:hypothetical protein
MVYTSDLVFSLRLIVLSNSQNLGVFNASTKTLFFPILVKMCIPYGMQMHQIQPDCEPYITYDNVTQHVRD